MTSVKNDFAIITDQIKEAVDALTKKFPHIHGISDGYSWGAGETSLHLGDAAEGGLIEVDIDGEAYLIPAADYYGAGVRPELQEALSELGYFAEWYDPGTLIAYKED